MDEKLSYLSERFKNSGFIFSKEQEHKFYAFYEMLIEKNKVMNLTGITEFSEVVEKHFLDSIFLNRIVDLNKQLHILDVGTGAGFPGIPLKIAFPELKITLLDSLKKRTVFLEEAVRELKLPFVEIIHARAEDLAGEKFYRESFDLCVSRAVANLSTLSEYCIPFVRIGGMFVSYKSGEIEQEILAAKHACRLLGGNLKEVYKFDLEDNRRSFVIIEKVKETPKKFPRKSGTPSKFPLYS